MFAEYISFIFTFIATAGLSVIGILTALQLYSLQKKTIFLVLLYHQIFLISFFVYSIWGNLVLREIISDIQISEALAAKLAIFIPVLGMPFLIVSWFMLLKFGFLICQRRIADYFNFSAMFSIAVIIVVFIILAQKGIIKMAGNPDIFIVRILLLANLAVHLFLIYAFVLSKSNSKNQVYAGLSKNQFWVYLAGVAVYSVSLSFFNIQGFVSTCFSILILFAVSILIPVFMKINLIPESAKSPEIQNIGFDEFCRFYEISKREAEIIIEICSGKSNKEISEKLFITLQTVKDHTHHIYTKTGINSRIQLANLVREKTGVSA